MGKGRHECAEASLMRLVESCATRLTNERVNEGPVSFPLVLRRCVRIEHIICDSYNLSSLEECPSGLKSLYVSGCSLQSLEPLRGCTELEILKVYDARNISDLTPLNACTRLKKLTINYSQVTDISVLSSMPLLQEVDLGKFV
jgi:Leucine-rich repeat (LRR) protein